MYFQQLQPYIKNTKHTQNSTISRIKKNQHTHSTTTTTIQVKLKCQESTNNSRSRCVRFSLSLHPHTTRVIYVITINFRHWSLWLPLFCLSLCFFCFSLSLSLPRCYCWELNENTDEIFFSSTSSFLCKLLRFWSFFSSLLCSLHFFSLQIQ